MIVKNRWALAGWIFMTIWMGFLTVMTYVFIREGGFRQFDVQLEIAVLAGFWFFGFAGTAYFFAQPLTKLEMNSDKIELIETWLLKKDIHRIQKSEIKDIYIKIHRDSDGDSHELILQTQTKDFSIKQSPDLEEIEKLKEKLHQLIEHPNTLRV